MIAYRGREANGQEQRDGLRRAFPLQKAAYFDTEFTLISGYLHKSLDRLLPVKSEYFSFPVDS
jgi:hypothetical protein